MIDVVNRLLLPLATRIQNLVARATVQRVNDADGMQTVQAEVLEDEVRDDVERVQNYGFTSVPLEGAEAVVVFVGGRRDHGLAVAVEDRRHRPTGMQPGEVAVYTDQGDSIVIKRGGTIEVTASTKVKVDAPVVELAGASEAGVLGSTYRTAEAQANNTLATQLTAASAALSAAGLDPTLVTLASLAAASLVTAGVALSNAAAALSTLEGSAAAYLSNKVKLG